jgi:hypothetical protein
MQDRHTRLAGTPDGIAVAHRACRAACGKGPADIGAAATAFPQLTADLQEVGLIASDIKVLPAGQPAWPAPLEITEENGL